MCVINVSVVCVCVCVCVCVRACVNACVCVVVVMVVVVVALLKSFTPIKLMAKATCARTARKTSGIGKDKFTQLANTRYEFGPLASLISQRTAENDNDKASKYFGDPPSVPKSQNDKMNDPDEGNELILKLRQQTEENREKNAKIVRQRTLLNDQVRNANFTSFQKEYRLLIIFWPVLSCIR